MRGEAAACLRQSGVIAGRQNDKLRGAFFRCSRVRRRQGRFLDNQMNIGAANPSGIDSRDTRPFATRPSREPPIDEKGTVLKFKGRILLFKMEGCGQTFMFKRKNGFD
jgi:hypothetical protein